MHETTSDKRSTKKTDMIIMQTIVNYKISSAFPYLIAALCYQHQIIVASEIASKVSRITLDNFANTQHEL